MIHADVTSRYVDGSKENREDCEKALKKWNEVILVFTLIMRYLRYKCITIYGVSTLYHLLALDADKEGLIDFESFRIKVNKMIIDQNLDGKANRIADESELKECLKECLKAFWVKQDGEDFRPMTDDELGAKIKENKDPTLRDLNLLPDASPSTMFGDDWLADTIVSYRLGGQKKLTGEYKGVFGETEQWLWASHRMIKQLWDTLHPENK